MRYSNKLYSAILLTSLSIFSGNSFADITLNMGEGIRLIAVNGEELKNESLFSGASEVQLTNGTNQILVNYTAEIKPGDDSELEVTQPAVILFTANNAELSLSAPTMKSLNDVEQFEKDLNWKLINTSGQPVPYKTSLLIKDGFQLSRDYEDELEEFNMSSANAALPKRKIFSPEEVKQSDKKSQIDNKNMAMDMLIYWYNQADEKTRRSFKELISK